ncbi:DUF4249 family protein [Portibacter marinus]|uniref:DUF4249 family protein n=1 Tax=Portibacter marinus TaxID=2898660 RepID=UPI001F353581|nr:DUF4249 family protein [Portibacter marinus]
MKYQSIKQFVSYPLMVCIILFTAAGCLDPIELEIPEGQGNAIVINAKIVEGNPSTFELNLSQIFSFTQDTRGRIIAKQVIIYDEAGNELEVKPTGDGIYEYIFSENDPISIEVGKSYKLSLEMFDGRLFESNFEPLLPVPEIENIHYEIYDKTFVLPDQSERTRTTISYSIDTPLEIPGQEERSNLKWEFQRVYKVTDSPIVFGQQQKVCYVSGNAGVFDINIYGGGTTTRTQLDNYFVYEEFLDRTYGEGLYFTVVQESLSKGAFEYWQKISNVLERKDNIYADPPGRVQSNYTHVNGSQDAYGYFYVTTQDTSRIYVDPELSGVTETRCPSEGLVNMDGSCGDPLCCDCASVDNSTTLKPAFWIQ